MSVAYFKYKNSILSFPKPKLYLCFWLELNYTSKKYYNSMHTDGIKKYFVKPIDYLHGK
jgi:hypothetical protein